MISLRFFTSKMSAMWFSQILELRLDSILIHACRRKIRRGSEGQSDLVDRCCKLTLWNQLPNLPFGHFGSHIVPTKGKCSEDVLFMSFMKPTKFGDSRGDS